LKKLGKHTYLDVHLLYTQAFKNNKNKAKKKNAYTKFPNYLPRYFDDLDVNCGTLLLYLFYLLIDS